jgi:hypothetical protein
MTWAAGEELICVDASASRRSNDAPRLVDGAVYTVASVVPATRTQPVMGVRVIEAPLPGDDAWRADRFRLAAEFDR